MALPASWQRLLFMLCIDLQSWHFLNITKWPRYFPRMQDLFFFEAMRAAHITSVPKTFIYHFNSNLNYNTAFIKPLSNHAHHQSIGSTLLALCSNRRLRVRPGAPCQVSTLLISHTIKKLV